MESCMPIENKTPMNLRFTKKDENALKRFSGEKRYLTYLGNFKQNLT